MDRNIVGTSNGRSCTVACRTKRLVKLQPYTGRCLRCRGHGTAYVPAITACELRINAIEKQGQATDCRSGGAFSSGFSNGFEVGE